MYDVMLYAISGIVKLVLMLEQFVQIDQAALRAIATSPKSIR
jgi:hypothetical protein